MSIQLDYDESKREGTLTFSNGRTLVLANVTREHAEKFRDKHGAEFQARDCILTTDGTVSRRSDHG